MKKKWLSMLLVLSITGNILSAFPAQPVYAVDSSAASQEGEIRETSQANPGEVRFFTSFEEGSDSARFLDSVPCTVDGVRRYQNVGINSKDAELPAGEVTRFVRSDSVEGSSDFVDNESKHNLFDRKEETKWLHGEKEPSTDAPVWVSFALTEAKAVCAYAVTSANDEPVRDPKDWKLYGSNDGNNWIELDTQTDMAFRERHQMKLFSFENSTAFAMYKFVITANNGTNLTQMSDLRLFTAEDQEDADKMQSFLDSGPGNTWQHKKHAGWSGSRAMTLKGARKANSRDAYAYNVLFENLDIPVTERTALRYLVMPQFEGAYDYDYTSAHVAIDIQFDDGSFLSESAAVDQNGNGISPQAQGESRTLLTREWNEVRVSLASDPKLIGKRIRKILAGYADSMDTGETPVDFEAYFDDISIAESESVSSGRLTDYVNTLRGTNSNSSFSRGLTVPATTMPHGFNFWAPVTNSGSDVLYEYQKNEMQHITISHEPSIWVWDRGTWQFMVNTSRPQADGRIGADSVENGRTAVFTHENEIAKAHYYSVSFTEGNAAGAQIEVSPTMHGAAVRFSFDDRAQYRNVIFDSVRGGTLELGTDQQSFTGTSEHKSHGMQTMYVYGKFDQKFADPYRNGAVGMVSFPDAAKVELKIATSFISPEQAKKNFDQELDGKTFMQVYTQAQTEWEDLLGRVEIEGASEEERITFYSNLYRLYAYPNLLSEKTGAGTADGWQYKSPYGNHKVTDGKLYYNNGFWDTYRTAWAAYALISPREDSELLDGLVQHYKDQGRVPRWIAPGGLDSMVGTSSDVIFADALLRGVEFDADAAWQSMLANAAVYHSDLENGGRKGIETSIFDGYMTGDHEEMSWMLESCINDYGLAQMARALGKKDEYSYYRNRALWYVNHFRTDTKWFVGRNKDGSWRDMTDPTEWGYDYTETNAWNMAFTAPHDGTGLAALYGGKEAMADKLDQLFTTNNAGDFKIGSYGFTIHEMLEAREVKLGQYGHNNQPSHHLPYMYLYTGKAYKTQELVRDILTRIYTGSRFGQGYIGDEDNGEMSAWYILSALGLYPLTMGSGQFVIGAPLFQKATIHMDNGNTLVIDAPQNSRKNKYVQGVKLNGIAYDKTYIDHTQLSEGAVLTFEMGPEPGNWGSGEDVLPPSLTPDGEMPEPAADMTEKAPTVLQTETGVDSPSHSVYSKDGTNLASLFDNDSKTSAKLVADGETASLIYTLPASATVEMYTVTSAAAGQSPTGIRLSGSNDLKNWTELDVRDGVDFSWKRYTRPFMIAEEKRQPYIYYRFAFTGVDRPELAELELIGRKDNAYYRGYLGELIAQAQKMEQETIAKELLQRLRAASAYAREIYDKKDAAEEEIQNALRQLQIALQRCSQPLRDAYAEFMEAESFDATQGISVDQDTERSGGKNIGNVHHGEWVRYENVSFGSVGADKIEISYAVGKAHDVSEKGTIKLVLDTETADPVAELEVTSTGTTFGNYVTGSATIAAPITGVHDVYLVFAGEEGKLVANVDYFKLIPKEASKTTFEVRVQAGAGGTVSPARQQTPAGEDSGIIHISPQEGYVVDQITADEHASVCVNEQKTEVYVLAVNADTTITVTFKPIKALPESLTIKPDTLELAAGGTAELEVIVSPSGADTPALHWSSSDEAKVKVDQSGSIKAIAAGIAEVTVSAEDVNISAVCRVRVTEASTKPNPGTKPDPEERPDTGKEPNPEEKPVKIPVKSVSLNMVKKYLKVGKSVQLKASILPADATDKTVSWKSSNTKVASVSDTGKVTARKNGNAVITAAAGGKTASVAIRIGKTYIGVSSVKLNKSKLSLNVKGSYTLSAGVKPQKASNRKLIWKSSDTSVLAVSKKGKLTAKHTGKATITAVSEEGGYTAKCVVTVKAKVKAAKLTRTKVTLKPGKTVKLKVKVTPKSAMKTTVIWKSANPKIASVSANGTVKAVSKGTTAVTAIVGHKKVKCKITVRK